MAAPQIPLLKLGAQGIETVLEQLQSNINRALAAVAGATVPAFLQGRLVSVADGSYSPKQQLTINSNPTALGSNQLTIRHGLGRAYQGWIVVRRSSTANIWEVSAPSPEGLLVLSADAPVNFTLWVF